MKTKGIEWDRWTWPYDLLALWTINLKKKRKKEKETEKNAMMSMNWNENEIKYETMNVKVKVNMLKAMIIKQKLEWIKKIMKVLLACVVIKTIIEEVEILKLLVITIKIIIVIMIINNSNL